MIILNSPSLLVIPILLPLSAGILCFLFPRRATLFGMTAAPMLIISAAILIRQFVLCGSVQYQLGGWQTPLGISLRSDAPSLLMVATTAVTGLGISLYARGYFDFRVSLGIDTPPQLQERYFWPLWMILQAALNALFLAGDIFNIYVTLELVGLSAVALATLARSPAAQISSFRYLLVNLVGSLSFLLGVAIIYRAYGLLDLKLLAETVSSEPAMQTAFGLISLGLLLKTALFPLHFWLPPAHANALAPVSAILSGLVVKASFYLLFRFWFDIFTPIVTPQLLKLIGILGAGAIIWGGLQALRQERLKLLVAYSTISQIGYLFIAFPLARLETGRQLLSAVLFMAMAHAGAKAAMFMAAGAIHLQTGHDRIDDLMGVRASLPVAVAAYAVAGVNIIGLPPSGGFIAKWQFLSYAITQSQWWMVVVIILGSLLACAYLYRVMSRLFVIPPDQPHLPKIHSPLLEWPALMLAIFSMFLGLLAPYPLALLAKDQAPVLTERLAAAAVPLVSRPEELR